jgi:zeaxanthin glucosyltransferase
LEALSHGVPLVALPIGFDQNGVAARLQRSKSGIAVPPQKRSVAEIRKTIRIAMADPLYQKSAQRLKVEINKIQGLQKAADLVEAAFALLPAADYSRT